VYHHHIAINMAATSPIPKDLYERLGVAREASVDEIRRAYKGLSRVKHPDRGGNSEEFQAIQEAHEVLTDDQRRRVYDVTGGIGNGAAAEGGSMNGMAAGGVPFQFMRGMGPFGMPGVAFDMGDMFGNFFSGGGGGPPVARRRRGGRGPNKSHDIGLTLADFYKGTEIKLKFNQARRCGTCSGSGAETTDSCAACSGSGVRVVRQMIGPGMMAQHQSPCDACSGEGKRTLKACAGCHGKKYTEREKQLDIRITPGMREGDTLVFAGECSDTPEYDAPGDVVLVLRRADDSSGKDEEYEWKGEDLWIGKQVTFAQSLLGFDLACKDHPAGNAPTYSWGGGPLIHGAVLSMVGAGMPRKSGGYGNLYIQITVTPPEVKPWSSEDAAKLQSVLGTPSASLSKPEFPTLGLHASEGRLAPVSTPVSA
jgi:DnaJ-class molecular chaperone